MKVLFLLLFALPVMALPTLEEARTLLASEDAQERSRNTLRIWKNGKDSLPLLRALSEGPDPEVAHRADFVLRRLSMGLMPDSPPELLDLAEELEQAIPDERTSHLIKLLEHAKGAMIALALLDQWAQNELDQPQILLDHASLVTESLLEHRSDWQVFFTTDLSPECRAAILIEAAKNELPMKSQIIAILAADDTHRVYASVKKMSQTIDHETLKSLARTAILQNKTLLALRILRENLPVAITSEVARTLAYLEVASDSSSPPYAGPWQDELKIFRARLRGDHDAVRRLNQNLQKNQFLHYENVLLAGQLTLPKSDETQVPFPSEVALNALHSAFATPPGEPDIEALSAAVLIDWTTLARTLTLLGSPIEAAEILATNGQITSAVNLLWRSKHFDKALALAQEALDHSEEQEKSKMRIILSRLYLEANDKEAARNVFAPLIEMGGMSDRYRQRAISLGLKLYPRHELLPLAPGIHSDQAYQRMPAIASFLPYPDKVAVTWYEHFREQDALQSPKTLLEKVDRFLNGDREDARGIISKQLAEPSKTPLLPSDSLYQNALFLQTPEALAMVVKAAWYQLSSRDLLRIIKDDSWPEAARKTALKTALLIDPTNPTLRWYDLQEKGAGELGTLHQLTLGDAGLTLQLAALTGKRESLKLAVEIANIRDGKALLCLTILAKSLLANDEPAEAARLLQVALCGEVAIGNQPATPIQTTLENLATYFEARASMQDDLTKKQVWIDRLKAIR